MSIIIVVDANIVISALLGGKPSIILFDGTYKFSTTDFTIDEVKKYIPRLAKKLGVEEIKLYYLLENLPIFIYPRIFYKKEISRAKKLIGHIDPKDVDVLALTLKFETHIWSQDKHLEECGYKKILKTYNFIN